MFPSWFLLYFKLITFYVISRQPFQKLSPKLMSILLPVYNFIGLILIEFTIFVCKKCCKKYLRILSHDFICLSLSLFVSLLVCLTLNECGAEIILKSPLIINIYFYCDYLNVGYREIFGITGQTISKYKNALINPCFLIQ